MDLEVFIHGVPKGGKVWGKEDDKNYLESFYVTKPNLASVLYVIETRVFGGKSYCYYHYLLYGNVLDSDSRGGSYLGLTIRLDEYCKDYKKIFTILNDVFNDCVKGHILKPTAGDGYSFVSPEFLDSDCQRVYDAVVDKFQSGFENNDSCFCALNMSKASGAAIRGNLYEWGDEEMMANVQRCKKVSLSTDFPTRKEISAKREAEKMFGDQLKAKETELRALRSELASTKSQLAQATAQVVSKESEISRLNSKLKKSEQSHKKGPKPCVPPIPGTPGADNHRGTGNGGEKGCGGYQGHTGTGFKFNDKAIVILAVGLGLLIFISLKTCAEVNQLRSSIENKAVLTAGVDTNAQPDSVSQTGVSATTNDSLYIGVNGYNEDEYQFLDCGEGYSANLMQSSTKQLYSPKVGHWEVKSGGKIEGGAEMNKVKFKVNEGAQVVTLQFVFDDSKKGKITRDLKVEKQK